MNCQNAALAVDAVLKGIPAIAGPVFDPQDIPEVHAFEQIFGNPVVEMRGGIAEIVGRMTQAGPGGLGIVLGHRSGIGHVFNVMTGPDGRVYFLDGQAGGPAKFDDGYTGFALIRTNRTIWESGLLQ